MPLFTLSLTLSSAEPSLALFQNPPESENASSILLWESPARKNANTHDDVFCMLKTGLASLSPTSGVRQIEKIVTTRRPGSFTGLRTAMILAKAFAYSACPPTPTSDTLLPIVTVDGSEVRALDHLRRTHLRGGTLPKTIWVVTDQSSLVRWADMYQVDRKDCVVLKKSVAIPTSDLQSWISETGCLETDILTEAPLLNARLLGLFYPLCQSKTVSQTLSEWIMLSPEYVGTRF